jgi:TRAP-type C4-dicarboxylate transport system substrate-binding protein
MLLIVVGCGSNTENEEETIETSTEKIVLTLAGAHASTHTFAFHLIEPFMEKVIELTDGQVEFEYYPAEQLGKAADLLQLTRDGATDIAYYASPYYPDSSPIGSTLPGIPGVLSNSYQGSMAYHTISKQDPILELDYLRHGVTPIATYITPTYDFYTKEGEIRVPKDLKGRQVRSSGGLFHELLEYIGATPVSLSTQETYEALDRGVIDTLLLNPTSADDAQLDELIKYATSGVAFGAGGTGLVMNVEVMEELPENVQEAIIQAGNEVTEEHSLYISEQVGNVLEKWKANGITVHELTEKELAEWQKTAQEFVDQYLEEADNADLEKAIDMLVEEAKKYE